jgi:DNA-binding CsgD family transcriptional regulator
MRATLEQALLSGDIVAAEHAAHLLLRGGYSLPEMHRDVIQPVLEQVGERWQHAQLGIAEEHLCSVTVRDLIWRLRATRYQSRSQRGQVVLMAPAGERHLLGPLMLKQCLSEAGWRVNHPDPLPIAEMSGYVEALHGVRLIGLSFHDASCQGEIRRHLPNWKSIFPGVPVIIGGYAVRRSPLLWQQLGMDGSAGCITDALELVDRLTNPLTAREVQVLSMASNGQTNEEIGIGLGVNLSTVKTHLERIYVKASVHDRAAAVATGLRRHWIA